MTSPRLPHPLSIAAIVGLTLLLALPSVGGLGPPAALAPSGGSDPAHALAGLPTVPPAVRPGRAAPEIAPSIPTSPASTRPLAQGLHLAGVAQGGMPKGSPRPLALKTGYDWSSAYVGYGPPWPPANLILGEGEGIVVDNARDEFVFFGGLGSGGLSNWTWNYEYYYNATNPLNSTENGSTSSSPTGPSARTNMSFAADQAGGDAVMFGGLTSLARQTTDNSTWLYYFANDTWLNISGPGAPPPREAAAFAVDQKDGIGLLFGGFAPHFENRGISGTVIWNDTWEFHFATHRWSEVSSSAGPGDRFGAAMVWDPVDDSFLLAGGCSFSCSMDTWSFSMANSSWRPITPEGTIPAPRAGAAFAWDPGAGRAVLSGGYSFSSNGSYLAYGDSFYVSGAGVWTPIRPSAPGPAPIFQPGPVYDASTTWANFPGCDAMTVFGGNLALSAPPEFVYVIQPSNDSPTFQCWSFGSQPSAPSPPPACSRQSRLVISVVNERTGAPVPNARVEISGKCLPGIAYTGADGNVTFTTNTPDNITINVSANDFHDHGLAYNYTYNNTAANTSVELTRYVLVPLVPYPALNVQVLGNIGGTFYVPIAGASVEVDNFSVVALTDSLGWGNNSSVQQFNQTVTVGATATFYSTSFRSLFMPYTGVVNATLVLKRDGRLLVAVVSSVTGAPVVNATGTISRLDPGPPAPFPYRTSSNGTFSVELPIGNYSANASAYGFQPNRTGAPTFLDWISLARLTLRLSPLFGTNVSVRLVDAQTGDAISSGTVTFGAARPMPTNPSGWANGTDLLPPGRMLVLGRSSGYLPNSTTITVAYRTTLPALTLRLEPVCLAPCGGGPSSLGPAGSPFFPAGGAALLFLLSAPALLAVAGALYALGVSARRGRPFQASPPGPAGQPAREA